MSPRAAVVSALLLAMPVAAGEPQPGLDQREGWVRRYGEFVSATEPRAGRAREVFERVVRVAERDDRRPPALVLIGGKQDPGLVALALPDGAVVLSRRGLDLCYGRGKPQEGDARLAFIFGHELSHLARDDFWHPEAFGPLPDVPPLRITPDFVRAKELQADAQGLLYALAAGYDVRAVLSKGKIGRGQPGSAPRTFLEEWVAQVAVETGDGALDTRERSKLLDTQLTGIADRVDSYRFGVRLAQVGLAEEAIRLLSYFREVYAGPEVLAALGVARYQTAVGWLADCAGKDAVLRFKLPIRLDPQALQSLTLRGGDDSCLERERIRGAFREAADLLEQAVRKDPTFPGARIDRGAVLVQMGEWAQAQAVAQAAVEDAARDAAALNLDAVSLYAFGVESGLTTDATTQSLRRLAEAQQLFPRHPALAFNAARILTEQKRPGEALDAWTRFLELEPSGPYANVARVALARLGADVTPLESQPAAAAPSATLLAADTTPVVRLGTADPETRRALRRLKPASRRGASGARFHGAGVLRVLELDDRIVLVEHALSPPIPVADIGSRHGALLAEIEADARRRTLVYAGVAYDVEDQQAVRRIRY